jgi:hypothetical protein
MKPKREHHASTDVCPYSPDEKGDGWHECMRTEMRCAYCGVRLDPYPCNGCGKFLTASEMSADSMRCKECE